MEVGRQAARSRSATLPLISGTDMPRKDGNGISRRRNFFAVNLPLILWKASRSGIPNTAGICPHRNRTRTMRDRRNEPI